MAERMLIVVDVQNDFCEGGALAVAGGTAVARGIAEHLRSEAGSYDRVVLTQDWHRPDTDNGGHFAEPPAEPDYVDTWPRHCVAGTPGAQLRPELEAVLADVHAALAAAGGGLERVRKGYGRPDYSGLQGFVVGTGSDADLDASAADGVSGRAFAAAIREGAWERVDVVGLAFDHCVRATALDAAAAGAPVRVIRGLTAAVSEQRAAEVEQELRTAGVELV